jgi:two-component system sensor histidine kinase TctE
MLIAGGAVMATALVLVFQSFAKQIASEAQDSQLLASAASIVETAAIEDGDLLIDIPYSALSMFGSVSNDRVFYKIELNGEFLSGYEKLAVAQEGQFADSTFLNTDIRVVSVMRLVGSGPDTSELSVSVAQTKEGITERLRSVFRQAAAAGLAFFAAATLLALWVSDRAFSPLSRVTASVGRRGPQDLSPIQQVVPQEMTPLVGALNDFTRRLKRALDRSEDFIAEAAHRIRTPLAVVRTQADVVFHRSDNPADKDAMRSLIQAVDESSRTAGQLLDHAMVNLRTDALKTEMFDLSAFLTELIERLRPIAKMREIELHLDTNTHAQISADSVLLESAFSNVLDNAIKYSPEESVIEVRLLHAGDHLVVEVLDQGPGFVDEVRDGLFNRFQRGKAGQDTIGSGLGLTIAKDVVEAHNGTILLENRKGGGACVRLLLPL